PPIGLVGRLQSKREQRPPHHHSPRLVTLVRRKIKYTRRIVVERRRGHSACGQGQTWHFKLACGHTLSWLDPSMRDRNAKTLNCSPCQRGECVKHDLIERESDGGFECTRCPYGRRTQPATGES